MKHVIWLSGLSGSGKTTLGQMLVKHLRQCDIKAELIDGDVTREFFEDTQDYSRQNRIDNIKRIAFAAYMLARNDVLTIVANIAPYAGARDFIRAKVPRYCQIYLKAPLAVCESRDVKGLYTKARSGQTKNFIGIDDAYEEPRTPDLVIETDRMTVDESLAEILRFLTVKSIL